MSHYGGERYRCEHPLTHFRKETRMANNDYMVEEYYDPYDPFWVPEGAEDDEWDADILIEYGAPYDYYED